jgi:hypothetical protein
MGIKPGKTQDTFPPFDPIRPECKKEVEERFILIIRAANHGKSVLFEQWIDLEHRLKTSAEAQRARELILSNESKASDIDLVEHINVLWSDAVFKRLYQHRNVGRILDVSEIWGRSWQLMETGSPLLTRDIMLKAMPSTTGIVEFKPQSPRQAEEFSFELQT